MNIDEIRKATEDRIEEIDTEVKRLGEERARLARMLAPQVATLGGGTFASTLPLACPRCGGMFTGAHVCYAVGNSVGFITTTSLDARVESALAGRGVS